MSQNKINTYTCPQRHVMVTIDLDEGVTPMMKACPTCNQLAKSGFYNVDQTLTPTHEWYKPKYPERLKNDQLRDHCERGGLLFRKVGGIDETEYLPEQKHPMESFASRLNKALKPSTTLNYGKYSQQGRRRR